MTIKPASRANTMTRSSLASAAQAKLGFSRRESRVLVDDMLDIIAEFLVAQGEAKLSSFGRFRVRSKGARQGRNPQTGESVPIAPRKVVSFRPSLSMRDKVRGSE